MDIASRRVIGRRLANLRKNAGYRSQRAFGKVLGVSGGIVGQWECGAKIPSRSNLVRIAELTGVSVDYILGSSLLPDEPESLVEKTEREIELLALYRAAPVQFQKNLVNLLRQAHLLRTEINHETEPA